VTPWLHATLDLQVIDSALPRVDTTWLLAGRVNVDF
jgi:porin